MAAGRSSGDASSGRVVDGALDAQGVEVQARGPGAEGADGESSGEQGRRGRGNHRRRLIHPDTYRYAPALRYLGKRGDGATGAGRTRVLRYQVADLSYRLARDRVHEVVRHRRLVANANTRGGTGYHSSDTRN